MTFMCDCDLKFDLLKSMTIGGCIFWQACHWLTISCHGDNFQPFQMQCSLLGGFADVAFDLREV